MWKVGLACTQRPSASSARVDSMDPVHRAAKTGSETWQNARHEGQLGKKERVIWE